MAEVKDLTECDARGCGGTPLLVVASGRLNMRQGKYYGNNGDGTVQVLMRYEGGLTQWTVELRDVRKLTEEPVENEKDG